MRRGFIIRREVILEADVKKYGVVLIGAGHIGTEHVLEIYYREDIRVVAVVDCDIERAKELALRAGCSEYGTDYREYITREDVDIVIIATYTASHLAILRDCLACGKHVLCEKPIATSIEEGREFVELVKRADTKVLIAHILRHNSSYNMIRRLIGEGKIGKPTLIRMTQNHHALGWDRYKRLMEDCSPAVDCGVHYFDIAEWLTGERIEEVYGFGTKTQPDTPRDNFVLVGFKMSGGCAGFYEVGWGETVRSKNVKEIVGTEGRITLEMRDRRSEDTEEGDRITVYTKEDGKYETINLPSQYKNMYAQLKELIRMIEDGSDGNPTIDDVWRAFSIASAAVESIDRRAPILIDEFMKR